MGIYRVKDWKVDCADLIFDEDGAFTWCSIEEKDVHAVDRKLMPPMADADINYIAFHLKILHTKLGKLVTGVRILKE
jgi:hypothetical protein